MSQTLCISEFFQVPGVILDVRSPGEYEQGHIPGAVSFPLFSNAERAQVGICYKEQGRELAIELGLELVGPKLAGFVQQAKALASDRQVRVHCWRGGMRSSSMGWLLETAGLQVTLLEGGYKAFRRWVLAVLAEPRTIFTLGGMTGTGKTALLYALADRGEQILDLEKLAHHRGSSYGRLGLPPQPTNEQFENKVALAWAALQPDRPVWIEAESRRIGLCRVPDPLFQQMFSAPVLQIERPRSERVALLLADYGQVDRDGLIAATERLRKRLGGLATQEAVDAIRRGDLAPAIERVLDYYDSTYRYDLQKRGVPIYPIEVTGLDPVQAADRVLGVLKVLHAMPLWCARP
ncbi:tRNA 2-selenouridine(34) synthase MnmH [Leptolyngbya sp. 'hensonii']|nr:tRNA 2-selenouridine(34) synthase MnmH [Leptolyngbya sp. 'hensonii']